MKPTLRLMPMSLLWKKTISAIEPILLVQAIVAIDSSVPVLTEQSVPPVRVGSDLIALLVSLVRIVVQTASIDRRGTRVLIGASGTVDGIFLAKAVSLANHGNRENLVSHVNLVQNAQIVGNALG